MFKLTVKAESTSESLNEIHEAELLVSPAQMASAFEYIRSMSTDTVATKPVGKKKKRLPISSVDLKSIAEELNGSIVVRYNRKAIETEDGLIGIVNVAKGSSHSYSSKSYGAYVILYDGRYVVAERSVLDVFRNSPSGIISDNKVIKALFDDS